MTFPVSFELFPPRTDAAALALGRTIDQLVTLDPQFISVTFGAGGSTRDRSLTVLRYILEHTHTEVVAHLTAVGSTRQEATALVRSFLDAGVTSFLALRGDAPEGQPEPESDFSSASELVELILAEGAAHAANSPTNAGAPSSKAVSVAVAAFPHGHPRDERPNQDLEALLAKQRAGATQAITQLFWYVDDYTRFVERARAFGITLEILPGIMPVINPARLDRLVELTGVPAPQDLLATLSATASPEDAWKVGLEFGAHLGADLVRAGAPGVHLYTFNQHQLPLATVHRMRELVEN